MVYSLGCILLKLCIFYEDYNYIFVILYNYFSVNIVIKGELVSVYVYYISTDTKRITRL